MARNKFYTPDEDARLLRLVEDNPQKKYIDIARLAIAYGSCSGRNESAIASHISRLLNPVESTGEPIKEANDEQLKMIDLSPLEEENRTLRLQIEYLEVIQRKYDALVDALINRARSGGVNSSGPWVYLNFTTINALLRELEPEMMVNKIQELSQTRAINFGR